MESPTPADRIETTLASADPLEPTAPGDSVGSGGSRTPTDRRQLGHYLLLDELGRGGMGVVRAAHDSKLGRQVAIKMLATEDASLQRRLIREAQAMAKLTHPNVVSVYEIGEHDGVAFIVMEYVQGRTLRQWLAAAPRSMADIVDAFVAAGRGLAAIHAAGLIHRDFKPDNVMIRDSGQVLVMDLGIARHESSQFKPALPEAVGLDATFGDLTREGALMGSPGYMAAEQFNGGEVTPKTDQFSFCVSLWEALYGERPFESTNLMTLIDAVTAGRIRAAKRSEVPAALRTVLERGLQAQPSARFESMTALLEALERASGSRARVRSRLAWAGASVALIVLAVVAVLALIEEAPFPAPTPSEEEPTQQAAAPPDRGEPHRQITFTGTATLPALSPDGEHLVFVEDKKTIVHVDMSSGETRKLPPAEADVHVLDVANDGSLLVGDKPGTYRMSSLESAPVRVDGILPAYCRLKGRDVIASVTPPGKFVLLSDENGAPIAQHMVEGEYQFLTAIACDSRNNRVAVLHSLGKTHTLKLIDLDGEPARVLLETDLYLSSPHFDQAGHTIYYLANHPDGKTNLEAARVAPSDDDLPVTRVVVPNIDARAFSRADSGRVAFVRDRRTQHGIWRLGPTDNSLERAEQIVDLDVEEVYFAVSPDETQLAYVETRQDLGRMVIRSLTDGSEREVTRGNRLRQVAWSPDGQSLAFVAQYRGQEHVWTVPATGGTATVFKDSLAEQYMPLSWAPLERILYKRPGNRNFGVLDPITHVDRPLIEDDSVGWMFMPAVSPDGGSVAVNWNREGEPESVWVIDVDDGTPRQVLQGKYGPLAWTPDGQFILLTDPESRIHRVASTGGQPELWRTIDFGPRREVFVQFLSNDVLVCSVVETGTDIWIAEAVE